MGFGTTSQYRCIEACCAAPSRFRGPELKALLDETMRPVVGVEGCTWTLTVVCKIVACFGLFSPALGIFAYFCGVQGRLLEIRAASASQSFAKHWSGPRKEVARQGHSIALRVPHTITMALRGPEVQLNSQDTTQIPAPYLQSLSASLTEVRWILVSWVP